MQTINVEALSMDDRFETYYEARAESGALVWHSLERGTDGSRWYVVETIGNHKSVWPTSYATKSEAAKAAHAMAETADQGFASNMPGTLAVPKE